MNNKLQEWSEMSVEEKLVYNGFSGFVKNKKFAENNMFSNCIKNKKYRRAVKEGRR